MIKNSYKVIRAYDELFDLCRHTAIACRTTMNVTTGFGAYDYLTFVPYSMSTIEYSFDEKKVILWMSRHWHWSFYYSIAYLVLIYTGQKWMKNREPYHLRRALCMWSTGLSAFSFYAIIRIYPHARRMVYLSGWEHAVCDTNSYIGSVGAGIWAFLFPLSKLPELVDTAFIVLRKQKMVFLHWYHHITVFIYCWFSYGFPISTGIWFGIVNYTVHALMYAYYAVKASGRNPPRWIAKSITTIQLSQMFVGIFLNYMATRALLRNKTCEMTPFTIGLSIFFYTSYAILFGNFFYWTYIHKKPLRQVVQTEVVKEPTQQNGHACGVLDWRGRMKTRYISLRERVGNGVHKA